MLPVEISESMRFRSGDGTLELHRGIDEANILRYRVKDWIAREITAENVGKRVRRTLWASTTTNFVPPYS